MSASPPPASPPPEVEMSLLIAHDAPLLSPVEGSFPIQDNYNYYLPPSPPNSVNSYSNTESPIPTTRMLKMPEMGLDSDQLCLPTHQLFDLSQQQQQQHIQPPQIQQHHFLPPSPPRSTSPRERLSLSIQPPVPPAVATKRPASPVQPAAPAAPKKRAVGERISTKDFVPPDVSGLSKREARLVKNRAAAFLSRQRKREEFEYMEVRVAELEKENARLLALTQNGNASAPASNGLTSEIEKLRAQLAAAQERERELAAELSSKSSEPKVKEESTDESGLSTPPKQAQLKSAASLGLMQVLLCALPSLLSMPTPNAMSFNPASIPTSPTSGSASFDFDLNSILPPGAFNGNGFDPMQTASGLPKKLEVAGGELGNLDISFDASPSEDGKIRVRIHPSSSAAPASSRATSPGASSSSYTSPSPPSMAMWSSPEQQQQQMPYATPPSSSSSLVSSPHYQPLNPGDQFLSSHQFDYDLGVSSSESGMYLDMSSGLDYSGSEYAFGSEYSISPSDSSKRRVRIALKSMPQQVGEGGEWEVQWQ